MSPLHFRPAIRIPWQALAGFAAAVYLLRSAIRGWDFRPDLLDVLVFGALAVILILRPLLVRWMDDDNHDPLPPRGDGPPSA